MKYGYDGDNVKAMRIEKASNTIRDGYNVSGKEFSNKDKFSGNYFWDNYKNKQNDDVGMP